MTLYSRTPTCTATISHDIAFTLISLGSNQQSESAGIAFSQALTDGTGSLGVNYGVLTSGTLPSGGKQSIDLRAIEKSTFGVTSTIQFSKVKSILVKNAETTYGWDINVHATGASGFTEPWNGGSGAILVKPYGVWQYDDPISGATVDTGNKDITLEDVCGSGATWTLVVVGVTG